MWRSWEIEITLPSIDRTFSNVPIVWLIVYVILLATDKLDGTLARYLKAESELGATLDIIADTLILAMGATLTFVWFVRDGLETWQFWLYLGILVFAVGNRALTFLFAKIYHGKGGMVHTYYQKFFVICCLIIITVWVFLRTIPAWSIYYLITLSILATIDECTYCARTAEYNVNFKGHGFEKYKRRDRSS